MSWVQQTAPPPLQQQQQHPTVDGSYAPPTTATAPFFGKPSAATANFSAKVVRSQTHPNAGSAPFTATQPLTSTPLASHHQQQQPLQQQPPTQGYFNNQQQQHWQQQNYLLQNKMMQPAGANNWQQQQNVANANMYQQNATAAGLPANSWQQPELSAAALPHAQAEPAYENYYAQTQPTQHQMPQTQPTQIQTLQPQPQYGPHDAAQYYQQSVQPQLQQPQQPQQSSSAHELFEASNGNNSKGNKTEGWGDWDWNDNSNTNAINELQQSSSQQHRLEQQKPQQQQHFNSNLIEDSFSNDNWSWNMADDTNANIVEPPTTLPLENIPETAFPTPQVPTVKDQRQTTNSFQVPQQQQQQLQHPESQPQLQSSAVAGLPLAAGKKSEPLKPTVAAKPTSLPLPEPTNDNYNNLATTPPSNNIPNSVYVSQAKPVSRPSRQYASPPGGTTPADSSENTLTPPQEFQNTPAKVETMAALSPPPVTLMQPPPAMTPPTGLLPPAAAVAAGGVGVSNPFKRAGTAQHHRAGLMPTTQMTPVVLPSTFSAPPPPADFATPLLSGSGGGGGITLEPDNSEILHENQEVIAPPTGLPLPNPNSPIAPPTSMHGGATTVPTAPPPNDERNQYLQTSHLSENPDEELNMEGDTNLPPPGLSRLVLGEPELEASQRLVTGTEEPNAPTNANMHIEERHADGEDTSMEQLLPGVGLMNLQNAGAHATASTSNIDITTDRNLYLVPGESNGGNEQRVVTGVETSVAPAMAAASVPTQVMSEQREIVLDGENLDDQQPPPIIGGVTSRNEPPLEGAASSAEVTVTSIPAESLDSHHHSTKSKDHSNVSTGNESDPHQDHHYSNRYSSNKVRKHADSDKKSEKLRRGEKQRSVDRYDSEIEDSEEYSSDRERERRRVGIYREGSVRSERDEHEDQRDYRDKRNRHEKREKRDSGGERDKAGRDKYYYRGAEPGAKSERRSQRYTRYDDEAEESLRNKEQQIRRSGRGEREDRGGRSDRSDRDYDDYHYQRGHRYRGSRRGEKPTDERRSGYMAEEERRGERRHQRRDRGVEREDYDTLERRRREKQHHPRGVDPREYEDYRKQSSRNARDSDLEKERARAAAAADPRYDPRMTAMYGYSSTAYPYDPYAYYYEQMARTNPQAYAEWYKKYYGHAAALSSQQHAATAGEHSSLAATDGRESVHSGRSSAHNEKDRSGNISLRDAERAGVSDPQRLTPCKFVNEHAVVSLSAGILVTVKPRYTQHGSISNIVKLQRLGANDASRQLYQAYPGPLVRGLTHKKTIIEFCEEQIRLGLTQTTIYAKHILPNNVEKNKSSYTLMWHLLILLLRQNGMVVGTDIAELLVKNQQQFPYETYTNTLLSTVANSKSDDTPADSDADEKLSDGEADLEQERDPATENNALQTAKSELDSITSATKSSSSAALSEQEVTDKFRNYLLYGNVNEALDWATDNNLWGHALFLASKVDRRSHANVMMKFANKLSLNDPLQTLYQLMSGRTPSSVTSVQDEKWGDWRPHLSMILSNTSQKPELDRKAITTLGDSLFHRGDLFAAHFCYLMAQVGFGRYQESASQETNLQQNLPRLVLLGSSHYKQFRDFAHDEAIMMTEIYEYACSLNDDKFSLVEFQPYKYLLATRLLDYGYNLRSLMYMEQIALHIERDPSKHEPTFIQKVYELADRLKYYDPVLEKPVDEQLQSVDGNLNGALQNFEEQKWLQNLRAIVSQHKVDYNIPATAASGTANAADVLQNQQNQIDQQFVEINKQFNELNLQYANNVDPTYYNADTLQQQQQQQQQVPQQMPTADSSEVYNQQPQSAATVGYEQQPQYGLPVHAAEPGNVAAAADAYGNYAQQYAQPSQEQQQQQAHNTYYDPSQHQHQQQQQYNSAEATDMQNMAGGVGSYDYWTAQQNQQYAADENTRPSISMPKSKSYDSDEDAAQRQQMQKTAENQGKNKQQQQQRGKNDKESSARSSQQANQNSGWFGGIWNKLSLKPKNQMILPDDKNPSIVWDPEKKRWTNTDGEEATEDSLKPPPKMSDIVAQVAQLPPQQQQQLHLQQQQQPQQHAPQQAPQQAGPLMDTQQYVGMPAAANPGTPAAPVQGYSATAAATTPTAMQPTANELPAKPKTPSLQSNMFKMQRNRTLKNSYVDVFNPSGAPMSKAAENVLAPAVPPAVVPQGSYFIPGAAPMANDTNAYQQQQQQQPQQHQQQDVPQFYNPNQFGAGGAAY